MFFSIVFERFQENHLRATLRSPQGITFSTLLRPGIDKYYKALVFETVWNSAGLILADGRGKLARSGRSAGVQEPVVCLLRPRGGVGGVQSKELRWGIARSVLPRIVIFDMSRAWRTFFYVSTARHASEPCLSRSSHGDGCGLVYLYAVAPSTYAPKLNWRMLMTAEV